MSECDNDEASSVLRTQPGGKSRDKRPCRQYSSLGEAREINVIELSMAPDVTLGTNMAAPLVGMLGEFHRPMFCGMRDAMRNRWVMQNMHCA